MVAGERSGDLYGARLARALSEKNGPISIFGCGGGEMRRVGVETVVDSDEVTVVGITEVIPSLPRLYRAFRRLLKETDRRRPRAAILIDFPDFNLCLAKKLKRRGIPVIYFVSPQVWAWRRRRVRILRDTVRKMISIFPFERNFYRQAGLEVEYVGHPLVETVAASRPREEWLRRHALAPDRPLVALLPGSRKGEVRHNLPPMLAAAALLAGRRNLQFVLPAAATLPAEWLEEEIKRLLLGSVSLRVVRDGVYDAVKHSHAAVVASGTATVETALLGCPMVVVYRVSPLTWLVGKLLVRVSFYSMVNLIAEKAVVRELLQKEFTAERVAAEVERLLDDESARGEMMAGLRQVRAALGEPGAIERAAEVVRRTLDPGSAEREAERVVRERLR